MRTDKEAIDQAKPDGVIRLATWLGVAPNRHEGETEKSYKARCAKAVMRKEKELARSPKNVLSEFFLSR